MRKLFTLFALLTCFLSANAKEFVDAEVDFSKYTDISEFKFFGWGASESAVARLSIQDGCLHFQSEEATDPSWDCQFHPIGGFIPEVGVVYTLHYKVKGSINKNISLLGLGQTPYGQFPITTEWVEGTFDYECTEANGNLLMQCGDYVGSFDIAYLKITHEGKEERPVEWKEELTNGDAEKSWAELGLADVKFDDLENNFKICAWSKQKGTNVNMHDDGKEGSDPFPAEIIEEADGNHAFIVRGAVADTEGDASGWDNQFWIQSPQSWKEGTELKIHFRYKASVPCKTNTQIHNQTPSNYKHWQAVGDVNFTTEWQEFDGTLTINSDMANGWSIAFNLNPEVKDAVDFYFDDLSWKSMVLEEGLFITAANTTSGMVEYDFDTAEALTYSEDDEAYVITVGKAGDKDSWVNEVMISTVRGNSKAFKANTIKCNAKADTWVDYTEGSNAKIKLPAAGVWTIYVDNVGNQIYFEQVEGDIVKEPLNPEDCVNATEVVVNAGERNMSIDEAKAAGLLADPANPTDEEKATYNGQPWDNQFFLIGNRALAVGEEVYLKFEYKADAAATVGSQNSTGAGGYLHYAGIGNLNFTTEWQTYEGTITIPAETKDNQDSWTFNLSNMKEANKYYFKNIIFMTGDKTENLIATETTENLWVKERGVNENVAYQFGTDPENPETGINSVVNGNAASGNIYNLNGQRVTNNFKGIVVKNGKKFVVE